MKKYSAAVLAGFIAFWVIQTNVSASQSASASTMDATVINGAVYVKASSLLQAIGGEGTYDSTTKTFHYVSGNAIPEIIKHISPSVVAVIGKPDQEPYQQLDRFNLAHGTGVIFSEDGWIVTNAHVVNGMQDVTVLTNNQKQYKAKKIFMDTESDIAILKINASHLQPATFADSDKVQVGQQAIAIGTPVSFALANSATVGVISGVNRAVQSGYRLLQTDAAINPGNSGGPLVNLEGKIIGINSMKFVDVTVDSLGFSIPSNTVQYVMHQLKTYGKVNRPYLGFEVEESWEAVIGLSTDKPLIVSKVEPDSAAAKLGIREGDALYSIDKQNISTKVDLNEKLKHYKSGDKIKITILSNGDLMQKTIVLQKSK